MAIGPRRSRRRRPIGFFRCRPCLLMTYDYSEPRQKWRQLLHLSGGCHWSQNLFGRSKEIGTTRNIERLFVCQNHKKYVLNGVNFKHFFLKESEFAVEWMWAYLRMAKIYAGLTSRMPPICQNQKIHIRLDWTVSHIGLWTENSNETSFGWRQAVRSWYKHTYCITVRYWMKQYQTLSSHTQIHVRKTEFQATL